MSWIAWFAVLLVAAVVGELLGEVLATLLSPMRLVYRPPHGGVALIVTWIFAVAVTVIAFRAIESVAGVVVFMSAIPLAVFASLTYREELREIARDRYLPGGDIPR